jgi:hypothetical protein
MPVTLIASDPQTNTHTQHQLRIIRSHRPGEPVQTTGDEVGPDAPPRPVWVFEFADRRYTAALADPGR